MDTHDLPAVTAPRASSTPSGRGASSRGAPARKTPPPPPKQPGVKRLLIVDDELAIVEALEDILSVEGYDVVTAFNGAEGLRQLVDAQPDLVLLDLMMPVMDGREMLRRMRDDEHLRAIPVVVMSAGRISEDERRATARFLPKPFELDTLLDTLTEILDPSASPDSNGSEPG